MRIYEINSVAGVRSTGRIAADIADALLSSGHEARIAYGRFDASDAIRAHTFRTGSELAARVRFARGLIFDDQGKGAKGATRRLIRDIEAFSPDIIHLHNVHGYYLNVEMLFRYLAKAGVPVVWTLHDCWPFTGHCAYFDYAGCDKWQSDLGCHDCPEKREYPPSLLFDRSKKSFREKRALFTALPQLTLITPSHWLAGLVKQSFLGGYEVRVIPNGIDRGVFRPTPSDIKARMGMEGKHIALGVASIWDRRKGAGFFLALDVGAGVLAEGGHGVGRVQGAYAVLAEGGDLRQGADAGHGGAHVKVGIGSVDIRPGVGRDEQQSVAEVVLQGVDQPVRAALDGADFAQGGVHGDNVVAADGEGFKQLKYVVAGEHESPPVSLGIVMIGFCLRSGKSCRMDKLYWMCYNEGNTHAR